MDRTENRPVFRVMRRNDTWIVKRPQNAICHVFEDLYRAIAFVRQETCAGRRDSPAIDLRIEDIGMVAFFDSACRPSVGDPRG
jgi:hypothetical protein